MADETSKGPQSADQGKPDPQPGRCDPKLLELLVCPLTKTRLDYDRANQELISRAAGLAYPIRDGIPCLTRDEARELK